MLQCFVAIWANGSALFQRLIFTLGATGCEINRIFLKNPICDETNPQKWAGSFEAVSPLLFKRNRRKPALLLAFAGNIWYNTDTDRPSGQAKQKPSRQGQKT